MGLIVDAVSKTTVEESNAFLRGLLDAARDAKMETLLPYAEQRAYEIARQVFVVLDTSGRFEELPPLNDTASLEAWDKLFEELADKNGAPYPHKPVRRGGIAWMVEVKPKRTLRGALFGNP